jgi:integrin alpha FG-GAP repeat containing protein 1
MPISPAIGDYNIDGYPDLLLLTASSSGSRNVNLIESRPCDSVSCSNGEILKSRRAFRVVTTGAEALPNLKDVETAHWLDLDDDVRYNTTFSLLDTIG